MNGHDGGLGGPSFQGRQQGVGNTWWSWGYDSDGITQNANGSLNPTQYRIYRQWRPSPRWPPRSQWLTQFTCLMRAPRWCEPALEHCRSAGEPEHQ